MLPGWASLEQGACTLCRRMASVLICALTPYVQPPRYVRYHSRSLQGLHDHDVGSDGGEKKKTRNGVRKSGRKPAR